MENTDRANVIGMQGNRKAIRPALEKYFPAEHAAFLLRGSDWTRHELLCVIAHLEKIRRPSSKIMVPALGVLKNIAARHGWTLDRV